MHRAAWLTLGFLAACSGELPSAEPSGDGGILIVPESYHEAMNSGGHLKHVGRWREDAGRIECRDCHALDTEGFASPSVKPCKSCHEERAGFHHGPTDGGTLPDGGNLTCFSCHPFVVHEGKKPVTPWVCLDCHARPIGEKKAITVHDAACFYCHQPHREPFTKPTDCTVCHQETLVHGAAKGTTIAQSCMQCHERHSVATDASKQCVACHSDAKEQSNKRNIVTEQAIFKGHPSCGSCHRPHRFAKNEVKACTACHENRVVLARNILAAVKNDPKKQNGHAHCVDCHDPHTGNSGAPKRCESCHDKVKNTHPAEKTDAQGKHTCLQCHPVHDALPPGQIAKTCISCHDKDQKLTGIVHGKDTKTKESLTCAQCHAPHAFKLSLDDKVGCRNCHLTNFAAVMKVKKSGHAKCEDCHAGLPHKPADKKQCVSCHEKQLPPQKGHAEAGCVKCHDVHAGTVLKTCTECHKVPELPGLHVIGKHQKCETCHAPHGTQPYRTRTTCLTSGCHQKQTEHEPKAERCNSCHLFRPAQPGDTPATLKK